MATIDCICPPTKAGDTRHPDGDTVTLRERLDFRAALTARNAIALAQGEGDSTAEILAALTEAYLILGVESWTLVDERGKDIEVSKAAIREVLLAHPDEAMVVADEADDLYRDAVIAPLAAKAAKSSPPTQTTSSTSARNGSPTKRPKPSRPSSTTTTRTVATVTTLPSRDGDSSSSPNLESVG
jgi:hypothetical protein